MKSLKNRNAVHGNEQRSKLRKHEVNLPKNGMLRFQVGLLISLMLIYLLINLPFLVHAAGSIPPVEIEEDLVEYSIGEVRVEKAEVRKTVKEEVVVERKVVNPVNFTQVGNSSSKEEAKVRGSEEDGPVGVEAIPVTEEDDGPIYVNAVEFVPLFPGCSKALDKEGRIACMNEEMDRYIQRYFNTGIAGQYGLQGVQRIHVKFTISTSGKITDVQVRAPHPALEKEVKRIVAKFPDLKPGMQGAKPVDVIFVKPIVFRVD